MEEDVLQGRDVSGKVRMRCLVSKGRGLATDKDSRIFSALKGTPSETEASRDILVNKPDYAFAAASLALSGLSDVRFGQRHRRKFVNLD